MRCNRPGRVRGRGGLAARDRLGPATSPTDALKQELRDAQELYEDAVQEVLGDQPQQPAVRGVVELEEKSPVRKKSLPEMILQHADLHDKIAVVLDSYGDGARASSSSTARPT